MEENKIILYKDNEGKVNFRFTNKDVRLTRENLAEIDATITQNISLHVGNIYQDQELSEEETRKKIFKRKAEICFAHRYYQPQMERFYHQTICKLLDIINIFYHFLVINILLYP